MQLPLPASDAVASANASPAGASTVASAAGASTAASAAAASAEAGASVPPSTPPASPPSVPASVTRTGNAGKVVALQSGFAMILNALEVTAGCRSAAVVKSLSTL